MCSVPKGNFLVFRHPKILPLLQNKKLTLLFPTKNFVSVAIWRPSVNLFEIKFQCFFFISHQKAFVLSKAKCNHNLSQDLIPLGVQCSGGRLYYQGNVSAVGIRETIKNPAASFSS